MLKEELQGSHVVSRLEVFATHVSQSTGDFYDFEILLCETDVTFLTTNFEANYSGGTPTAVFELDTLSIDWSNSSPDWNGFNLDTPYPYSGSENLIVEFRYLGDDGHSVNARAASLPSGDRCLSGPHPSSSTGSFMSFLTSMRIHFNPQNLERSTFGSVKVSF